MFRTSSAARVRRAGARPLLAAALLLCAGCGGEAGTDVQADPNRLFEHAMAAVHAGDWEGLRPLLTKRARTNLERDLNRLRRRLAHAEDGKQERRIAKARLGAEYEQELQRATTGGLSDVLALFVKISPRPPRPRAPQRKFEQFRAEILYATDDGTLHAVRLVRLAQGWFIDDLQL